MRNVYQPPKSDVVEGLVSRRGVRYGLLALVALAGFPLFQFVAWVVVPIANRLWADLALNVISSDRDNLILIFDLVDMAILYWLACLTSVAITGVNAWAFGLTFGFASGVVIVAEKGWVLVSPDYAFPIWYELVSVFLGLVVSTGSAINLRWGRAV